jgi:choline monooxygenase
MINIYSEMMDVDVVLPLTDETCEVIIDFYCSPEYKLYKDGYAVKDSITLSEIIQQEDIEICERVQEGMRSSSFSSGVYSAKREDGMFHFHKILWERYLKW